MEDGSVFCGSKNATTAFFGFICCFVYFTSLVSPASLKFGSPLFKNANCFQFPFFTFTSTFTFSFLVIIRFSSITINLGPTFLSGALAANADAHIHEPSCPLVQVNISTSRVSITTLISTVSLTFLLQLSITLSRVHTVITSSTPSGS